MAVIASALFVFKSTKNGRKLGLTVIGKPLDGVIKFFREAKVTLVPQLYKKGIYLLYDDDKLDQSEKQSNVLQKQSSVFGIYVVAPFDVNHLRNFLAYLYHDNNFDFHVAMEYGQSVILERFFGEGAVRVFKMYKRQKQTN